MIRHMLIFVPLTALLLAGCSPPQPTQETDNAHKEAPAAPTNRIDIPANVRNNLGITFAKVERRSIVNAVRAPGQFELWPDAEKTYRTITDGRIQLLVKQHDEIKVGDELFRYRPIHWPEHQQAIVKAELEEQRLQSELLAAQAAVAEAKSLVAAVQSRITRLKEAGLVKGDVQVALDTRRAAVPVAQAAIAVIEAKLNVAARTKESAIAVAASIIEVEPSALLEMVTKNGKSLPRYAAIDWLPVNARFAGLVHDLHVTDGDYANAADQIVSVVDYSRVRFRSVGLQDELAIYTANETATLAVPNQEPVEVELHLGHQGDSNRRTIDLLGFIEKPDHWMLPGVSGFLEVNTRDPKQIVLAIPRSAVVRDGIVHIFFRRDPADANKAIRIEADLGDTDGYWVEIKSGLSATDEVVVNGAYELKLATEASGTSQKGGHFHADGTYHDSAH